MGELSYTVGGDSNLVSFKSAARVPITSLKAYFKPKQNLHGYSKPWPAGGGNNIWDEEWELGRFDTTTGENVDNNEQIRCKNYIPVLPNAEYRFVGSYSIWIIPYDENKNVLQSHFFENNVATSGNSSTFNAGSVFTIPNDCYFIRFYLVTSYGTTYNNNIAINYPSSVTTYSPYENICPIEGWTSANIYATGEELPFVGIPGITDSLGIHFVVDDNGIITAEGTPTSWSQVMCKKYAVNGDEILYGRIIGNLKNVTNVMPQLYDANGTRLYYGEFGDGIFDTYLDLKQYPGVKTVIVGIKRLSNGIPVTGQGTFVLTKGSRKSINTTSVTFPITGKNLFNVTDDSIIEYFENIDGVYKNTSTDTRSDVQLAVQLWKTKYTYIKLGGILYNVQTGHISFQFTNDNPNCAWIRFKYNGNNRDFGMVVPFPYGLGTYTVSCDVLSADPTTVGGLQITNIQIERGTAATAYEPYSADDTFYGGYINPAAGEAQSTWYLYTITGDEEFLADNNNNEWVSAFAPSGMWASNETSLIQVGYCTHYPYAAYTKGKIGVMYNERTITFDASIRDAAGWKAFCKAEYEKGTPVQVCYPLKNYSQPIPIKKNNISTFINTNTVWSNTNSNTEVSYAIHDTAPIRAAKKRMVTENDKHYRKVLWNQILPDISSDYWRSFSSNFISTTFENGIATSTFLDSTNIRYSASVTTKSSTKYDINHKYYISYMVKSTYPNSFGVEFATGQQYGTITGLINVPANEWCRGSCISYPRNSGTSQVYIPFPYASKEGEGFQVKVPILIDLTAMFGLGNEPTREEFEKLCAINNIDLTVYHPIDSGTEQIWCISGYDTNDYTVVNWNQNAKAINSSNYKAYNSNCISVTFEDDILISTWLSDGGEYSYSACANYSKTNTVGNYYYLTYEYYTDIDGYIGGDVGGATTIYKRAERNQWARYSVIVRRTEGGNLNNYVVYVNRFNNTIKPKAGNYCKARNIIAIDLTQMFGAGNEPLTVDDLYATCLKNNINLDEAQPYTTGSIIIWKK